MNCIAHLVAVAARTLASSDALRAARTACVSSAIILVFAQTAGAESLRLENNAVRIDVDRSTGCFTVLDKRSGSRWQPDPWEGAVAVVRVKRPAGGVESWNLSKCRRIEATGGGAEPVRVSFRGAARESGGEEADLSVSVEIALAPDAADLDLRVLECSFGGGFAPIDLLFPARHFALRSERERGLAVIPFIQGLVIPSWSYPMRNSKFADLDDAVHGAGAVGELDVHGWTGLAMPWFGTCTATCGAMAILPADGSVRMQYIVNYNDRERFNATYATESPYPRILALTPLWDLRKTTPETVVRYHFLSTGGYTAMAKHYRGIARQQGLGLTLREKAAKIPGVEKMRGAIDLHIYGGYPHYVGLKGMAFSFQRLAEIIRDLHDDLDVSKAILTVWGTWENYPPYHWPVNEAMGGEAALKRAFDLAKSYGYLITPYHTWTALLEHDPNYDASLLPRRSDGKPLLRHRWGTTDHAKQRQLAESLLPKELAAIGSNVVYTDASGNQDLFDYLRGLNLPITIERGGDSERTLPYIHCLEGMAPYNIQKTALGCISVEAPLFNLVYHDAVMTANRWQSPDNDYDLHGDYPVRALRNMAHGHVPMFVAPPWEYSGIRDYIRNAVEVMAPLHAETAFEELLEHEFLSDDFSVERSRFANNVEVTVNLGPVERELPSGKRIAPLGFHIRKADGETVKGRFQTVMRVD